MESLSDFFHRQLDSWPMAADNFASLSTCRHRVVSVPTEAGAAEITLLFNPARVRSTAAKVDAASIAARPCFLCSANRPMQQQIHHGLEDLGYDILVNPYPILNPHYTIVAHDHAPQLLPLQAMLIAADRFPHLVFFFNGARAGASAPDHLHFQAVAKKDLTLIAHAECAHNSSMLDNITSQELGIVHPATFISRISCLSTKMEFKAENPDLLNSFIFRRADGMIQQLHFPRLRHRAESYPNPMVSPGALDVAGIMVTVREQDFNSLTPEAISGIYQATCL